jgi:anti-sigma B factor antagonist
MAIGTESAGVNESVSRINQNAENMKFTNETASVSGDFLKKLENCTLIKFHNADLDENSPLLKQVISSIADTGEKNIILDISGCSLMQAGGISAILHGDRVCRTNSGIYVLTGLDEQILELLKLTMLDSILNITSSVEEAIEFIKA